MNTKILGKWGETVTAEYLRKRGWRILDMGYRCPWGEIDIVAERRGTVAFVEVKLRKNADFAPAYENVTAAKQKRLKTTASVWMEEFGNGRAGRFDVAEVYAPEGTETKRPVIHIIEDAFR